MIVCWMRDVLLPGSGIHYPGFNSKERDLQLTTTRLDLAEPNPQTNLESNRICRDQSATQTRAHKRRTFYVEIPDSRGVDVDWPNKNLTSPPSTTGRPLYWSPTISGKPPFRFCTSGALVGPYFKIFIVFRLSACQRQAHRIGISRPELGKCYYRTTTRAPTL